MTAHSTKAPVGVLKPVLGWALAAVAVGAVAFGVLREIRDSRAALASPAIPRTRPAAVPAPTTTVYYFHGNTRCPTCVAIENRTNRLVNSLFAEDIASGRVRFLTVNFDTPENRHFREDFGLSFGSVVVSDGEKWENLSDVWKFVHEDLDVFDKYVAEHVLPFVKAAP